MNTKNLTKLVVVLIVALVSYFFGDQKTSPKTEKSNENVSASVSKSTKSAQTQSALALDYDVKLANDKFGVNAKAPVDYYMLALSWSPAFCESQRQRNGGDVPSQLAFQCASHQQFGWVIHGLWPQNAKARSIEDHPRFCQGDLPALSPTLIEKYLPESPGASLLQGEWEKHGACAFDNAEAYFAKQKALFYSLKLPEKMLRANELFRWMRKNNPQLERVYLGASKNELYVCYDKQWQPIDCPK